MARLFAAGTGLCSCCCPTCSGSSVARKCPVKLFSFKKFLLYTCTLALLLMLLQHHPTRLADFDAPRETNSLPNNLAIRATLTSNNSDDHNNNNKITSTEVLKFGRDQKKLSTLSLKIFTGDEDRAQDDVCSYQKSFHLTSDREVDLKETPFSIYVAGMKCLADGHVAIFNDKYARLDSVVIDPGKARSFNRGGEEISAVISQDERKEYLTLQNGFFSIPCEIPPSLKFGSRDHLRRWAEVLSCYNVKDNNVSTNEIPVIDGTVMAIQRYEYANVYCTMTEFYNTFVMMMLTGSDPSHVTSVLLLDAHPKGTLDSSWEYLYGRIIRAGHLQKPTKFSKMVWSLLSYSSPLWTVGTRSVPYLEEFRRFFLTRHNASADHRVDCSRLKVVVIWRRNYVAHPRNPSGVVSRKFANEDEILSQVKATLSAGNVDATTDARGRHRHHHNVTGVQLDKLTMAEQVGLISTTDLLVGMHGAGLAHVMFLAPTSGFLEIFPPSMRPSVTHFQAIAKWRNLATVRFHNADKSTEDSVTKTVKIDLGQLDKHLLQLKKNVCP